ncbi:hypothetical protein CPB84DRAFT_59257 [Gymnopilus junonius]|uniref:Uncharacterized protein n=1 Tax=Gymnopilus junonius TaxID=109634 RepID=A0A9P5P4D6_GYMJU|nr:hypothetical protein CPB84DRAFT_59257 [Gymnopilus junonius]
MASQQPVSTPTSPERIKKVEHEIIKEAKDEEKNLKKAIKDLTQTEKDAKKANKGAVKAEQTLEKSEKKEQSALKDLYKAENAHDVAVSSVHQAQQNLELSTKRNTKVKEALQAKSAHVDEAMKANEEHTKSRNARLTALRGPAAANDAGRVVPEPDTTVATGRAQD